MKKNQTQSIEIKKLKDELKDVRLEMKINEEMFNLAVDENLVEAIIYDKMSLTARHGFLVNKIREYENTNETVKI